MPHKSRSDVAIVVAGQAGQGIQTIESILTTVLKRTGYHVFATKEYMSRIRGGSNSTLIRVGHDVAPSNVDRIDILVPLDGAAIGHLSSRITPETLILGDKKNLKTDCEVVDLAFTSIAEEAGGKIFANTVAIAVLYGFLEGELDILEEYLSHHFKNKGESTISGNLEAARRGYTLGCGIRSSGKMTFDLQKDSETADDILMSGGQAVALGAAAGGCRFISSYPMSPGTTVLAFMARNESRLGVVVEQAEDEIAAVNMAIGAWYAGARAMVTTSGGGFSLMEEGISLAGVTESPLVVHIGQRPGPATGMATRTEQADLDLALHSGHGEFPRVIYTPGTIEEAFELTCRAFDMADRFQIPVFVLTDQYFLDSLYSVPDIRTTVTAVNRFVRTEPGYQRYTFKDDGISPRGIPGFGDGLVCVDSHEHTEEGHITEDIGLRNRMMEKRMGKMDLVARESISPTIAGPADHKVLVICWGSNFHIVVEAVSLLDRDDIAVLHFSQVFPLPHETLDILVEADTTIAVENNYTGQFEKLLRTWTGFEIQHHIRQYDGRPFCAELLAEEILRIAGGGNRK